MSDSRRAVRVFAAWLDDPTECRLAFDLILDPATRKMIGRWPVFGATDLERASRRPFLLDAAGVFHFDGGDRAWRTDLREQRIEVGARFTVWWTQTDRGVYAIVKIAALGSKALEPRS